MATGASAATVRVAINGSVQTTAVAGGDPSIGISLSGVAGDLTYTGIGTSTGTLTETFPSAPIFSNMSGPGATLTAFDGDVSQGCVRIQGNQAIVIGHLAPTKQFDLLINATNVHYEWVGTFLEDNGAAGDRAASVFFRTANFSACNSGNTGIWTTVANNLGSVNTSTMSFGYTDLLNVTPPDGKDTDVAVTDPNGLSVSITDAADPAGLSVAVGAGGPSAKATLDSCGKQVKVDAGSTAVLTCSSLIAEVVTGSAEVVLDDGLSFVSIPEGAKAEISDDGSGGSIVENLGTEPITVTNLGDQPITVIVDGVEGTVEPGETSTVEAWDFQGFFGLSAPSAFNKASAGSAVALKWRVLDASVAPVTDLSTATISVSNVDCTTRADLGGVAAGGTIGGLQNLGNGYYQLNWKTAKNYVACKAMHLDIGDGVTHDALFNFTK